MWKIGKVPLVTVVGTRGEPQMLETLSTLNSAGVESETNRMKRLKSRKLARVDFGQEGAKINMRIVYEKLPTTTYILFNFY